MFVYICVWIVIACVAMLVATLLENLSEGSGMVFLCSAFSICLVSILVKNGII